MNRGLRWYAPLRSASGPATIMAIELYVGPAFEIEVLPDGHIVRGAGAGVGLGCYDAGEFGQAKLVDTGLRLCWEGVRQFLLPFDRNGRA